MVSITEVEQVGDRVEQVLFEAGGPEMLFEIIERYHNYKKLREKRTEEVNHG